MSDDRPMADPTTPEERAGLRQVGWCVPRSPGVLLAYYPAEAGHADHERLYTLDADRLAELVRERDEAVALLEYAASRGPHANCELAQRRGRGACSECTFDNEARAFLAALDREVPK